MYLCYQSLCLIKIQCHVIKILIFFPIYAWGITKLETYLGFVDMQIGTCSIFYARTLQWPESTSVNHCYSVA